MFNFQAKWAVRAVAVVTLVAIIAGCSALPVATQAPSAAPTMPAAAASPAAPAAAATPAQSAAAATPASGAASLDGAWDGSINVAGQAISITLKFKGQGGTIDIPAQGARDLRMENFSSQGNQVKFEMLPAPRTAFFTGAVDGDKISGTFEQSGIKGTWSVTQQAGASAVPTAAEPYKEEEVTFKNGQYTLAGTLSLPEGAGPHPAVVLISGSGAQNRDEEILGFKPFAILADALTRKGIAVLRYDDRGIGGSTTGTMDDTSETYANDVGAAFDYLKTRSEIDPTKIGLLGHSEGGIIAPMVAVNKGDVAFLVLLAGPGEPGKQILIEQTGAIAKASGADQATVDQQVALQKQVLDAVLTGQGLDQVQTELVQQFKAAADKLPQSQREALGDLDKWAEQNVQAQLTSLQGAWMKFFLTHDPAPVIEKVHAPILALFGGKDVQVPASSNEPAIKAACEKAGNKDCTTKVFPDANHLFQAAQTGGPNEYATLKPEFAPGVVDTITSWVVEHSK